MIYRKGHRVKHPTKSEWGVGQVLADSNGDTVTIFFVGAGEKQLSLAYVSPERVRGAEAENKHLDNLTLAPTGKVGYSTLEKSVKLFLEKYPKGFHDEQFVSDEREAKDAASAKLLELLPKAEFSALKKGKDWEEITKRALQVLNATNLVFPNEKMALKDGLAEVDAKEQHAKALFELLYGNGTHKDRFDGYVSVLEDVGAAKWTTATYFPFLLAPADNIFIKPTITQNAASLCRWEINYKPAVNWKTYEGVLKLAQHLFEELEELKPRDLIDVQSFMWCVSPT